MFGSLRASCGGRTIDRFPTQKTAALLAYLALFPRTSHSREVLAETFWPDADPESQRHSLRLALSRLRALLGPDHPLETERLSVRLNPARFVTDVAEFEGAVARKDSKLARRLYAGSLLPGYYDSWLMEEQSRLECLNEALGESDTILPLTLPQGLGRLFGRLAEQAAIAALLQPGRIVTLTGPGGMGKTRLAAAVAKNHGRAIWVHLADLSDGSQVADALRGSLRLPAPAPGFAVEDLVARELEEIAPVLLVFDNTEQLVGASLTAILGRFLRVAGVSLLVTSRRVLGLTEEAEVPLGPLGDADGAALFEDRAKRSRPGLAAPTEVLHQLSRRLGGMPLALELAAARAGVQELSQIEAANWTVEGDFGESLGIPARQRSLDKVLRASLDLLEPETRRAFDRLAVFRGGFDAAAAHAVADAGLAQLEALRRWALIVSREEPDGTLRFRLPEPLRDVAAQSQPDAAKAHAEYFADWIEANRADDLPPPPRHFGQRLALQERERDNVRAALETCQASNDPADRETGLRIVAAFWTHWYVRNAGTEMETWARSLLVGPGGKANPLKRAAAQLSLALAVRESGSHDAAAQQIEGALHTLKSGPRDRNLAFAWHLRGLSLSDLGRAEEAEAAYLESEQIWTEIQDTRNFGITRHNRAMLAADCSNLDKADVLVGEAMELFRQQTSTYVAIANATIGSIRRSRGDYAGAAAALAEAAALHRQMGYVRGWAQNERDLALCLHQLGKHDEARQTAEQALAAFRRVGDRHGEATALAALSRITSEPWHADEARGILARHRLHTVGELLKDL